MAKPSDEPRRSPTGEDGAENDRLAKLEVETAALRAELAELRAQFAEFRKQFE